MPLHETEAFVLRTYSLAEAHKICVFLTRASGKVRGVAYGARKLKSRFGSALEPFTEVALTFFQKEGRELVSVSTCDIVRSHFHRGARDAATATAFSYMSELLVEFLPEHETNEHLYRLVSATLESIEQGQDLDCILRYFETWLLRLAGFFPDVTRCAICTERVPSEEPVFLASEGAPRCQACSGGRGISVGPSLRITILRLLSVHPTAFAGESAHLEHNTKLGELNYQIIRHALERDLRSHGLLKVMSDK
jgi:DNA repair protein RecO (recombination protein O)